MALPAIEAIRMSSKGSPTAAAAPIARREARSKSAGPSAGMRPALASRPRSMALRSWAAPWAKRKKPSVPAPRTNHVLTSWLFATSPRSSAWSSFFSVGSKERSPLSSSAMALSLDEHVQAGLEIAEPGGHHRRDDEGEEKKAEKDRRRQRDEEHLHLRHQLREDGEARIEDDPEDEEGRGDLDGDPEGAGDRVEDQLRGILSRGKRARAEQPIAVEQGGDDEVVEVACEDQSHSQEGEEPREDRALLPLRRVERGDE